MFRGPHGLTLRQERFCRAYVEWGSATTAARQAKYAPQWAANHGYRLLRQPRIRARIAQVQAEMAAESCRHGDVLLGKLEAVYRRALNERHFHAAARAVDLQAKLALRFAQLPGEIIDQAAANDASQELGESGADIGATIRSSQMGGTLLPNPLALNDKRRK